MALIESADLDVKQRTIYDNMKFTPYEFSEWPQAIPVKGGKVMPSPYNDHGKLHDVVVVNSQEELDALQGPQVKLVPVNPEVAASALRVEGEDDIRAQLYTQAEQTGAKIDKKWSVERIEDAIRTHVQKAKGGDVV